VRAAACAIAEKFPGSCTEAKTAPVNIELDHKPCTTSCSTRSFMRRSSRWPSTGQAAGAAAPVNMHPWKTEVQHIDFQRISADQKITSSAAALRERREFAGDQGAGG